MGDKIKMNHRTCVICKKKREKCELFRFAILQRSFNEIVIDINHKLKSRGFYFCKDNANCEKYLPNWVNKKKK